jgi:hypothetical protein
MAVATFMAGIDDMAGENITIFGTTPLLDGINGLKLHYSRRSASDPVTVHTL